MADEFDRFLGQSLAPPERLPDRRFVASVQARIALEQRLHRQRRQLLAGFFSQLAALAAVTAGIWVLARAQPLAEWFAASPPLGLAVLIVGFALAIALFSRRGVSGPVFPTLSAP
jgi:uncharacterized membrane protein HdeD (DUF308 family)